MRLTVNEINAGMENSIINRLLQFVYTISSNMKFHYKWINLKMEDGEGRKKS